MANMNMPDQWMHEANLIDHLAEQLNLGRLGLFLGAGVSSFYGLPDWHQLVSRLFELKKETPPAKKDDLIKKASYLRAKYYDERDEEFKADLKAVLYDGISLDFARIRENALLSALGSLVMSSKRGSAAKVFTLNYDDLLENYLEFHGFTTTTIWEDQHWASNDDVVVYHPHGFLPLGSGRDSDRIVLDSNGYHEIMKSDYWRPILDTSLRTHTFLYLGLSGDDLHLGNLINGLTEKHAISLDRTYYHGVRFALADTDDEIGVILENERIFTHKIPNYDALPDFLFKICQVARSRRETSSRST